MRILTLNIWGVPWAKHRSERIQMIANEIQKNLKPDILCFQEVYMPGDRRKLIELLKADFPHYHFFASGMIGSGLLTLSRFPIVDAAFHRFRMGGKPLDFAHGDYYAGKGIGLTRIDTAEGKIDVYNCHTHAQYEAHPDNEYAVYNEANLYEAARFIYAHSNNCSTVMCGDLNTRPEQLGHQIITKLGHLANAYFSLHGQFPISYSADNPYVGFPNQCLDYVLLKNAGCDSIEVVMQEHFSGKAKAYSDHYGLLADIRLRAESIDNEEFETVVRTLYQHLKIARIETENEQMSHFEHMGVALASIFDSLMTSAFLGRLSPSLGRFLRRISLFSLISFAFYTLLQGGLNLQARRNTLNSLEQELKHQIDAKCLFDGRNFEQSQLHS